MNKLKLIVTQLGRIGDMILLTPVFSALKDSFNDIKITVLASKHNHSVLKNNPNIEKILIYDKKILNSFKLITFLRTNKFDILVDPKDHHSSESQLLAKLIKAEKKVGFNKGSGNFNIEIEHAKDFTHYTQKMFDAFNKIGLPIPESLPKPELFESDDSAKYAKNFISEVGSEFYQINISASKESKMWQKQKWIDFINKADSDLPFVICSAPSESETAREICDQTSNSVLFKSRSLSDIISLTKNAKILITIDTALVHISAAWDVPLIGLFGGIETEFQKFKPLNSKYLALRNPKGLDGVKEISTGELLNAFEKFKV